MLRIDFLKPLQPSHAEPYRHRPQERSETPQL
jgi:hypothetical protein